MEPATTIIRALGGPSKVAALVGVHRTRVSNWMRCKEVGGTGGVIPLSHHRKIIAALAGAGTILPADALLPGSNSFTWNKPGTMAEPEPAVKAVTA